MNEYEISPALTRRHGEINLIDILTAGDVADNHYIQRVGRHGRMNDRLGTFLCFLDIPETLMLIDLLAQRDDDVAIALREQFEAIIASIQQSAA